VGFLYLALQSESEESESAKWSPGPKPNAQPTKPSLRPMQVFGAGNPSAEILFEKA